MNIKKLCFVLTFGMVVNSFASSSFPTGIYAGVGGGYNRTGSRFLGGRTENNFAPNIDFQIADTKRKNLNSFLITGFLGYLHIIKEYSLTMGGELFWSYVSGHQKFQQDLLFPGGARITTNSNFRPKHEYGFKIMLGYLINNINHVYGILGFSNKSYNEKITTTFTISPNQDQSTLSKNFSRTYILLGMGFERAFNKIKYGVEGIYQIGNKKTSLSHELDASKVNGGGALVYKLPGARKLENSYTILFKASYSFDVFH